MSELHHVARAEGFLRRPHAGDPVHAIPSELAAVVDHKQEEIAIFRATEGVRLDYPRALPTLLSPVVDIHLEAVSPRISNELEGEAAPPCRRPSCRAGVRRCSTGVAAVPIAVVEVVGQVPFESGQLGHAGACKGRTPGGTTLAHRWSNTVAVIPRTCVHAKLV